MVVVRNSVEAAMLVNLDALVVTNNPGAISRKFFAEDEVDLDFHPLGDGGLFDLQPGMVVTTDFNWLRIHMNPKFFIVMMLVVVMRMVVVVPGWVPMTRPVEGDVHLFVHN
jgi:hypothetical protein